MINGHLLGHSLIFSEPEKPRPCAKRTWCALEHGHSGACFEKPPLSHQKPPATPTEEKK